MTQDEYEVGSLEDAEEFAIIRMAREAGFTDYYPERLTRFAALVAAHEREACAKVCEELTPTDADGVCPVAAAIRARGEK